MPSAFIPSGLGYSAMADKGVVATLLPLTAFALKESYARGREMIDAGCAVAQIGRAHV